MIGSSAGPAPHLTTLTSVNLASRLLGASVLAASDESFGEKENLIVDAPARFAPGKFGHKGEIVDGWETRRRGGTGQDWAVIRLGAPGVIDQVDIDTSFFTGNFPPVCRLQGCGVEGYPATEKLRHDPSLWQDILGPTALHGDTHNIFDIEDRTRFTHLRLWIEPDGGVARLRAYGTAIADPIELTDLTVDLAARELGGRVIASSDAFYSSAESLNRPDRPRNMGEGWETQRRRDGHHDWVILALAAAGRPQIIEVDTSYFIHNASKHVEIYGIDAGGAAVPKRSDPGWFEVLPRTGLRADTRHRFRVSDIPPVTHLLVEAFPDGGMARLRAYGVVDDAARHEAAMRWFLSLPTSQAVAALFDRAHLTYDKAVAVVESRPQPATSASEWLRTLIFLDDSERKSLGTVLASD